jgi:RHH-type proline utilization regulon transcriptional repressor/proline dehydrogenase/delta 1-pyrroline-5-carboxylate dehydrogenase
VPDLAAATGVLVAPETLQQAIDAAGRPSQPMVGTPRHFPGPTGESNRLHLAPRGLVLALGPSPGALRVQVAMARRYGNAVLAIAPEMPELGVSALTGTLPPELLATAERFDAVLSFDAERALKTLRAALSQRDGPLIPLVTRPEEAVRLAVERHVCIDLTAAGGNAALIAAAGT